MDTAMDILDAAFPVIHAVIFVIGVVNNVSLLLASFLRTPKTLNNYSIMIKFGTLNDLISVFSDFFTMQRLLVIPGNLIYLSLGPCSLISPRACYLVYCMQLCTLIYSLYVMTASFAYRMWILNFSTPSTRTVVIVMILLYFPPAILAFAFTFAQADIEIVQKFLLENAPSYLTEPGALTGHSGMTFHLVFTILFVIFTPGPVYVIIMVLRHKILARLTQHSTDMSDRTKKMHGNLVQALTVHAMLPPVTCIGVLIYLILFFDMYHHVALEKAIFTSQD
ncbi:hypothetical protein PRIPAC_89760 [Pristionchus pacificus]|uniref:G protein-coupled receptor n=1 Tax=Pristionchus pacificus TaxID=54126 RepID=A0A2A6B6B6_PRIPA|nr:hypothetical protein PRIPAC_89760 [Pristionchus pacificus]|eukprot:PDM61417.1 G protein-coupled receptor [Pristionchus pacificus]